MRGWIEIHAWDVESDTVRLHYERDPWRVGWWLRQYDARGWHMALTI